MVTFVGVGVQLKLENGQPVIQRQVNDGPGLADGPAKEAGLKAGDAIIGIDGRPIQGWDLEKTVQSMRGGENTPVVLTIRRQGEAKPFEKTLVRKRILRRPLPPISATAASFIWKRGTATRPSKTPNWPTRSCRPTGRPTALGGRRHRPWRQEDALKHL